jgi:NAD(P)-dependent dehydrogenase (short-subunit alcohol dehydrogenase family)
MTVDGAIPRGSVVVTGASSGIGEACALRLARMGYTLFAGVRKDADGEALAAKAPEGRIVPVHIDVTDAGSIAAAAQTVARRTGETGVAGLVNNAGISVAGPLEILDIADLRRQLDVNVIGQVAVTQAFMPHIRKARGRIVNMGSVSGKMAVPFLGPYAASKFALEAITDSLRQELRPWGIRVSIVEPGAVATPIWDKGQEYADEVERRLSPGGVAMYRKQIDALRALAKDAAGRGIPADQVARAVAHAIASKRPKTRYVVGRDARLQASLAGLLPDQLMDGLIASQAKLPSRLPDPEAEPAPVATEERE